jgi:hypothetical protein
MRKFALLLTMLMFFVTLAFCQTRNITGTVRDNNGVPISGATITVKGTSTAVQSSADGSFSIKAATGNTLVVSNVGFANAEARVGTEMISPFHYSNNHSS